MWIMSLNNWKHKWTRPREFSNTERAADKIELQVKRGNMCSYKKRKAELRSNSTGRKYDFDKM